MKTSTVLKHAKKYLAENKSEIGVPGKLEYICFAVNAAYNRCNISSEDMWRIKDMIAKRLDYHATLEEWLGENHNIHAPKDWPRSNRKHTAFVNKLQKTRHAWVDSMIAEFKAKGD